MKSKKKFDAVKMMREIRDNLSQKFMSMSYEEQKKYIQGKIKPLSKAPPKTQKKAPAA